MLFAEHVQLPVEVTFGFGCCHLIFSGIMRLSGDPTELLPLINQRDNKIPRVTKFTVVVPFKLKKHIISKYMSL